MWEFIWRWETLWYLLLILYVPSCFGLIAIVLLQKGKGVGFAGAFGMGGGGSDTVFGPRMAKSLPQKLTYVMAAIFMVFALIMSLISGKIGKGEAPDRVDETNIITETDLSGLPGLGSELDEVPDANIPGGAAPAATPAPAETPPATDASPAETPPAADAAPAATPAPAETPPATDAPPAAPPAPVETPPAADVAPAETPPAADAPSEPASPDAS